MNPILIFTKLALLYATRLSTDCWRWIRQSTMHAALAALALSATLNLWQWHHTTVAQAASARRLAIWQSAFATEQRAFRTLFGAMAQQNASIDAWSEAGSARRKAAKNALRAAKNREENRESLARQILGEAAAARRNAVDDVAGIISCRTPKSVMDARAQL